MPPTRSFHCCGDARAPMDRSLPVIRPAVSASRRLRSSRRCAGLPRRERSWKDNSARGSRAPSGSTRVCCARSADDRLRVFAARLSRSTRMRWAGSRWPGTASIPASAGRPRSWMRLRSSQARGASFFPQLLAAARGGFAPELGDALWDLVWAGEVTNDSFHAVRALLAPVRRSRRTNSVGRAMHVRSLERFTVRDDVAGRWSLTDAAGDAPITPTERATAQIRQLLERHGVLTREIVRSEGTGGGFAAAYGILKAMEDAGRIRRGYFVAGLGAAQFALPGAVDRLRAARERTEEPHAVVLAATDPANPYGAALPRPDRAEGRKPMRTAGALVGPVDGRLAGWLGRGEEQLLTFIAEEADAEPTRKAVAAALAAEVGPDRRTTLFVQSVDGAPVDESPLADALREAGFARTPRGYLRRVARV